MPEAATGDGRTGKRRLRPPTSPTIIPPPAKALPGEAELLTWTADGEVTEEMALGVHRRNVRAELARKSAGLTAKQLDEAGLPADLEELVPDVLPSWTDSKPVVGMRFPPRLHAFAVAYCEQQGISFSGMTELLWWEALQRSRTPQDVAAAQQAYLAETVLADRQRETSDANESKAVRLEQQAQRLSAQAAALRAKAGKR